MASRQFPEEASGKPASVARSGCGASGTAMAATGRETSGQGKKEPTRPSLRSIRGRDANRGTDGRAEVTSRCDMRRSWGGVAVEATPPHIGR